MVLPLQDWVEGGGRRAGRGARRGGEGWRGVGRGGEGWGGVGRGGEGWGGSSGWGQVGRGGETSMNQCTEIKSQGCDASGLGWKK